MLHKSILSAPALPARTSLVVAAIRSWHEARRRQLPVQQQLYRTLEPHDCGMLAPVLDSLIRFFETTIRRPLAVGSAEALTPDERQLVDILEAADEKRPPASAEAPSFKWAVWSARIMISKVFADALRIRAQDCIAFA